MFDYLSNLISKLLGTEQQQQRASSGTTDLRRAPRARVRIPIRTLILGTEVRMGAAKYAQSLNGYTRDISKIGIASVLPGAQLSDLDLLGEYRRLKIMLELKPRAVEIFATIVYFRQRIYVSQEEVGWLIGARITKMSHENQDLLLTYLNTLEPRSFV